MSFYSNASDNMAVVMDCGDLEVLYGAASEAGYKKLMEVMEGLGEAIEKKTGIEQSMKEKRNQTAEDRAAAYVNSNVVVFTEYISSQEEMDLLSEDEFDRDYKIHSNRTCGMSTGFQYAVAERKGEEE